MSRIGTEFLDLGTWQDGEDPGSGPQEQDNSRLNGNWIKIDKFAKENKIWVGISAPPTEYIIEHTLWLDISNIDLPVMKKWEENPGGWIVLWTWNHGDLEDLEDDQHPQYLLKNGLRKLDANYTPEEKKSIATKEYVDALLGGWAPFWGIGVQDLTELRAIPGDERIDKQVRYVEDKKALYGYDDESNPIETESQIENCDDEWNQYVYYNHDPGNDTWITSEIDTTDKQEGIASIKLTANSETGGSPIPGALFTSEGITPIDLRGYSFIKLWVKPSAGFTNRHLYIVLTNGVIDDDTPPPEEVRLPLPVLTSTEWQEITLYFSDATVTGGNIEDILSNVTSIGLRLSSAEWVDNGANIMIDDIRGFKTSDDNDNYIVPDDLIGVWIKIAELTNPLQENLNANNYQIKNLGEPIDDNDAVRKTDLDTELNTKADKKDYPLQWYIDGFITDGSHIDTAPSTNGYMAGKQYAINHSGNNYNGNIYRVTTDDTWELLEARKKGLGILLKSNLVEYYYSSIDTSGWWNDNLSLKQDKPASAISGNIAVFDNDKNTVDSGKKISTSINDTDDEIATSKAVKTYVDTNGIDEKVKVNSNDSQADFLENKLEGASFDALGNIPKAFYVVNDYSGVKKLAIDTKPPFDYIVSNVAELDYALDDIGTSGIGGTVYLLKGLYDKGSSFIVPSINNIKIKSDGSAIFNTYSGVPTFIDGHNGTYHTNHIYEGLTVTGSGNNVFLQTYNHSNNNLDSVGQLSIKNINIDPYCSFSGILFDVNVLRAEISNCNLGNNGNANAIKSGRLVLAKIYNIETRGQLLEVVSNSAVIKLNIFHNISGQYKTIDFIKINSGITGDKDLKIFNNNISGKAGTVFLRATDGAGNGYLSFVHCYNNDIRGFDAVSDIDSSTVGGTYKFENNNIY